MPKTAILIPCYNASATILETLDSLKEQVLNPNIQAIILADDCSTDNTLEICQAYAKEQPKIIIVPSAQNQGERKNVNRMLPFLQQENIEWFMILHADDLAKATWVEENLRCIQYADERAASVCSSWDNWYPHENKIEEGENKTEPYTLITGSRESVLGTLRQGCWWHISGCMINVNAFVDIGGFAPDLPQLGDFDWLLRALLKGYNIFYIPRSLILYRQHAQSISSNSFRNDRDTKELLIILKDFLSIINPGILIFLWKQRLSTSIRRLAKSIVLLDFDLIKRRISTLLLVNSEFCKLLIKSKK